MADNMRSDINQASITEWNVRNFKSIKSAKIELAPLSILIGKNSSGKSSLIQTVLLMAQNSQSTADPNGTLHRIDLNGLLVNLGTYQEVLNSDAKKSRAQIEISGKARCDLSKTAFGINLFQGRSPRFGKSQTVMESPSTLDLSNLSIAWEMILTSPGRGVTTGLANIRQSQATLFQDGEKLQTIHAIQNTTTTMEIDVAHDEYDKKVSGRLKGYKSTTIPSGLMFEGAMEFEAMSLYGGIPHGGLVRSTKFGALLSVQENLWGPSGRNRVSSIFRQSLTVGKFGEAANIHRARQATNEAESELVFDSLSEAKAHYIIQFGEYLKKLNFNEIVSLRELERSIGFLLPILSLPIEIVKSKRNQQRELFDLEMGREELELAHKKIDHLKKKVQKAASSTEKVKLTGEIANHQMVIEHLDKKRSIIEEELKKTTGHEKITLTSLVKDMKKLGPAQTSFLFSEYEDQIIPALQSFWNDLRSDLIANFESITLGRETFYHLPAGVTFGARQIDEEPFSIVSSGVRKLNETLRKVVYLGPLRLEPRNVYDRAVSQISPQLPLGLKGELLARRIYENQSARFPVPPKQGRPDVVKMDFRSALNEWLIYLGLAEHEGIEVTPEASYGYKLLVDGRGLPAMGTGVSQVLPVIALCLMIPEGGLGLLEEPELHLNPAIQQKLGDFFLAVSKSDRQLLIETHSEYLVTRLRLRVAEDIEVRDQFNFIFTEWDSETGTTYRAVHADSDGLIHDWPKGFFDQVGTDVRALLKIAAAKKI